VSRSVFASLVPPALRRYERHLHHLRPARWYIAGGFLAGVVYSISTGAGLPLAMNYLLPVFFNETEKINPHVVEYATRFFGTDYRDSLLLAACIGLPIIFALRGLASFTNRYLINKAGFTVLESLRVQAYGRLLRLPLGFYGRNKAGDLNARLMNDTDKLKLVVVKVGGDIVKEPLTLLVACTTLVVLCLKERSMLFALIAILSVPLCVLPIRYIARNLVKRSRQVAARTGDLAAVSIETLQAPLEVQAYNLQERQLTRFATRIREIFKLSMKTVKYQAMTGPIIEFVSVCGFVAAIYFGTRHGMSYASFTALAAALYLSYEPVKKISAIHNIIKNGEASLERLEYILDAEDTVPQPAQPVPLPSRPLEIALENVGFSYGARAGHHTPASPAAPAPAALDQVSLRVAPGETVALVGASGAGKSTFISLIPRFYDPTAGRVTLAGADLRTLDKHELRRRIAIVPQVPVLLNATLAENIRLGRPQATDAEVEQAARRAHVHDFIQALPDGYATQVGERGGTLSGGQRQRIAIARAFLKDAPILILDEATSALDSESEAMIQQALRELIQGRTTFMIAHRFSSIRHASRILVFDHGRIVADGAHETLHATSPIYRDLYNHQMLGGDQKG
jgi:subfamily B ATP-binding cassette protein MsbA